MINCLSVLFSFLPHPVWALQDSDLSAVHRKDFVEREVQVQREEETALIKYFSKLQNVRAKQIK